jgi:hypothetical protein
LNDWSGNAERWSFRDDRRVTELARSSKTLEAKAIGVRRDRIRNAAMRFGVSVKADRKSEDASKFAIAADQLIALVASICSPSGAASRMLISS